MQKKFFYLTQTKYFYFKCYLHQNCYLHHNCSINLNWNITQLYSSAKPLQNVPSSVFQFVNLCFLPLLCSFSIQNWKKIWFCYICKCVGRKEMLAKMSKYLCWNLFIRATTQIRAVYKDHKILVTLKSYITLSFKFLDLQHKICIFLCHTYENIFHLFSDSINKTRFFDLKVNCNELRLVFVHHGNTECT